MVYKGRRLLDDFLRIILGGVGVLRFFIFYKRYKLGISYIFYLGYFLGGLKFRKVGVMGCLMIRI